MSAHQILPSGYGDWWKPSNPASPPPASGPRSRSIGNSSRSIIPLAKTSSSGGWGANVIQRLFTDLGEAFPDMKGFSASNLKDMRFFAESYPDLRIGQQPADQLPWFHMISLLTNIPDPAAREWYAMDLLFYHTRLKCHVVVELKADAFEPGHAGRLNFYLAAVDAQIKAPDDNSTIGLLLCKTRNHLVAEYALSCIGKPILLHPNSVLRLPRHSRRRRRARHLPAQYRGNRSRAEKDRGERLRQPIHIHPWRDAGVTLFSHHECKRSRHR